MAHMQFESTFKLFDREELGLGLAFWHMHLPRPTSDFHANESNSMIVSWKGIWMGCDILGVYSCIIKGGKMLPEVLRSARLLVLLLTEHYAAP